MSDSDRPTPIGEHHYRDTTEGPPPDFEDELRSTILPPPSGSDNASDCTKNRARM